MHTQSLRMQVFLSASFAEITFIISAIFGRMWSSGYSPLTNLNVYNFPGIARIYNIQTYVDI